jgi:hypothetical protein
VRGTRLIIVTPIGKLETTVKFCQTAIWTLDANYRGLLLDRFELIELALAAAGANLASFRPGLGRADIRLPEGPGAALAWAGRVDGAFASRRIEEHTIVAVGQFGQALSHANLRDVTRFKRLDVDAHDRRQRGDLFLIDPHIPRRASAAIAASGALKAEAVLVPGFTLYVGHVELAFPVRGRFGGADDDNVISPVVTSSSRRRLLATRR